MSLDVLPSHLASYQKNINKLFSPYAKSPEKWRRKNNFYHELITKNILEWVPVGKSILDVGSGDGYLLNVLKPSKGIGIDAVESFVDYASAKYPNHQFVHDLAESFHCEKVFDVVVVNSVLEYAFDNIVLFKNLRKMCNENTQIVIGFHNSAFDILLQLGGKIGLCKPQTKKNKTTTHSVRAALKASGYDVIDCKYAVAIPFNIPFLSNFINKVVPKIPLIRKFSMFRLLLAKPSVPLNDQKRSLTLLIPCRNERGNIKGILDHVPFITKQMEILFIDGNSTDGTVEFIEEYKKNHPELNVRVIDQGTTKGKGRALDIGIENSKGDIVIIYDSDLSVKPRDLAHFYDPLNQNRADFVNGNRLFYPMEDQAMRFLNWLGNLGFRRLFSLAMGQRIEDPLCGVKAFYRDAYMVAKNKGSFMGCRDLFGDFDLFHGNSMINGKILEVPVRYYARTYGDVKIKRFRHGALLLKLCLWKIFSRILQR